MNCKKWFPQHYKSNHQIVWVSPAERNRVQATECPVSQTTGDSSRWIRLYSLSQACKTKPVAGPISSWPNRTAEAFEIMYHAAASLMNWERREAQKEADRNRKTSQTRDKFGYA